MTSASSGPVRWVAGVDIGNATTEIVVATIAFARDVAGRTDFQGALE